MLERDEKGETWVLDSSTNGTLLNKSRLQKNRKVQSTEDVFDHVCLFFVPLYIMCR